MICCFTQTTVCTMICCFTETSETTVCTMICCFTHTHYPDFKSTSLSSCSLLLWAQWKKQQIPISQFGLANWGLNPWSTQLKASTLTITPSIRLCFVEKSYIVDHIYINVFLNILFSLMQLLVILKHFFPGISQLNIVVEVAAIVWYIVVRSTSINVRENQRGNQEWTI